MSVRQIEAFRAVMTAGTTKGAAEMLGVSQPAVSRLIAQFERRLRFDVFDRSSGRLTPTPEAIILNEEVARTFRSIDKIFERAQDIRDGRAGNLRIAVLPALAFGFIPKVVRAFSDRHPGTGVTIHSPGSDRIAEWAASQQIDLGIAIDPAPPYGIEAEPLCRTPYLLAVPADHRLACQEAVEPADLHGERFVSHTANNSVRLDSDRIFAEAGVARRVTAEAQFSVAVAQLVREGLGVGFVDPFTAEDFADRGLAFRPFRPDIAFDVSILYPSQRPLSRMARSFVATLRTLRSGVLDRARGKAADLTCRHSDIR